MINVLTSLPNSHDATSFYRGAGPLAHLAETMTGTKHFKCTGEIHNIAMRFTKASPAVFWDEMRDCDILFMQRPSSDGHLALARMAAKMSRPIWLDYDDDLFNVPYDNPTVFTYNDPSVQKKIKAIIEMADVVSVSTNHLAEQYSAINKNIVVVQNGIDEQVFTGRPSIAKPPPKLVVWRGSKTHDRDLAAYASEIVEVANAHEDWSFQFVGHNPWYITELLTKGRGLANPAIDILEYIAFMRTIKPPIMIVPLAENTFNKSKSNIAWIEGTFAGAVVMAPDWPEWQKPGIHTFKSNDEFREKLEALITDFSNGKTHEDDVNASWEYIKTNLPLSVLNMKRREIINKLVS